MSARVRDIDRGYKRLRANTKKYRREPNVTVGIQGAKANEPRRFGETNVTLALVHEFGSRDGRVPQRSFIRSTVDRKRDMIQRMMDRAARVSARYGNAAQQLGIIGEKVRAEMVKTIDQSIGLAPLAASTEERKGSTKPLIHTAQMKGAISWRVHNA